MAATQQQQRQEGVIDPFTIIEGGEGLRGWGNLAYSGEVSAEGKAEGRGTIRCRAGGLFGGWTIRGAAFCNGAMLPCRAMFAYGNGDAFAGQLAASGRPADSARGAVVRGKDGGRFEGIWPACGADNHWFCPLRGAAWVRCDGSVYAVTLDGRADIGGDFGWQAHFDWDGQMAASGWVPRGVEKVHLGVLTAANPAGQVRRVRAAPRGGQWGSTSCGRGYSHFQPFPTESNRPNLIQPLGSGGGWSRCGPGFVPRPGFEPGPALHRFGPNGRFRTQPQGATGRAQPFSNLIQPFATAQTLSGHRGPARPGSGEEGGEWGVWMCVGGVKAGACFCGQAALSGTDGLLMATEYEAVFAFADGRRLEGAFRGLCPQV